MLQRNVSSKKRERYKGFHFRGHEVKRIETFSDGVFAFAVTLLIVSLEVPKSFEELIVTMRGFFAFGISFILLVLVWHEQHAFFRRYGLDDIKTIVLNCILLFIVLFYVYPLKFLFTLIFQEQIYGSEASPIQIEQNQLPALMQIYGIGYVIIYFLFFLMYTHALSNKETLQLNHVEQFDTKTKMYSNLILICIGFLSVIIAFILPADKSGIAGMVYILIWPALTIFHNKRARSRKKIITD